ncbi:hypothetical protein ACWKWP_09075 [Agromyces soli]
MTSPLGSADSPRLAVLVEGASDAVVVEVLGAARGIRFVDLVAGAPGAAVLVPMGGVTNTRRVLAQLAAEHPGTAVLGLCDAPEARFVAGALRETGTPRATADGLERFGFFVCDADLEDELIRALGADEVLAALGELGEGARFDRFRRQPWWRERPVDEQLHRFAGSASGRKLALAERLAQRLEPSSAPLPLSRLLDRAAEVLARSR